MKDNKIFDTAEMWETLTEIFKPFGTKLQKMEDAFKEEKPFYCDNCETELSGDELEWMNDQPICPICDFKIEL